MAIYQLRDLKMDPSGWHAGLSMYMGTAAPAAYLGISEENLRRETPAILVSENLLVHKELVLIKACYRSMLKLENYYN